MEKKYQVGYVPGAFDLFHLGHLNLLRNSKDHCEYLIAGVVTDELVEFYKGSRPYIPFEERKAIVGAIRYVDEVVAVDFHNADKLTAWELYHYDCHFSGNDHEEEFQEIKRRLQAVGSDLVCFQYTMSTSSTKIKSLISQKLI